MPAKESRQSMTTSRRPWGRVRAVGIHGVDFVVRFPVGDEGIAGAVRRPGWVAVAGSVGPGFCPLFYSFNTVGTKISSSCLGLSGF